MKKVNMDGLELVFSDNGNAAQLSEDELASITGGEDKLLNGTKLYQWVCLTCGTKSCWYINPDFKHVGFESDFVKDATSHSYQTGHMQFKINETNL